MRWVTELVINGIVLVFLIILTIYSYKLIPFVSMSGSMLSFSLGISDVYYYIPVGVGAILIFIPVFYKTFKEIETRKRNAYEVLMVSIYILGSFVLFMLLKMPISLVDGYFESHRPFDCRGSSHHHSSVDGPWGSQLSPDGDPLLHLCRRALECGRSHESHLQFCQCLCVEAAGRVWPRWPLLRR